ncbi:hypothetical protein DFH06DRAFT_1341670 [Mycena polygramma]|nr:hypothetical protein DFH06DRAFT_1341670 [Mycena polygramma]
MYDRLVVERGFTPEYSNASDLLEHARQLWVGDKLIRQRRLANRSNPTPRTAVARPPPATVTRTSSVTTRKPIPTPSSGHRDHPVPARPPTGPSAKQCYGCGVVGHIASDPECPRNKDQPGFRDKPRMAVQRVIESYDDDGEIDHDAAEGGDDGAHEHWGGSQYESEDEEGPDPNEAPDLDQLVEALDDHQDTEPRVAAMRPQYYSMRLVIDGDYDDEYDAHASPPVTPPPVDTSIPAGTSVTPPRTAPLTNASAGASPTRVRALPHRSLATDMYILATDRIREGLPEWTPAEETRERKRLKLLYNYPPPLDADSIDLMEDYNVACVKTGVSRPNGDDYQAVLSVRAEEQARHEWEESLSHPVQQTIVHSPYVNDLPAIDGDTSGNRFDEYLRRAEEYQQEIVQQLTLRTFIRVTLEATIARPRSSYSLAARALPIAIRRNEATTADMSHQVRNLEQRITALISARDAWNSTLSEAAIARGEFSSPSIPVVYIDSDSDEDTPSLPPSYPGSPHSSEELWGPSGLDETGAPLHRIPVPTTPDDQEDTSSLNDGDEVSIRSSSMVAPDNVGPTPSPDDVCVLRSLVSPWPGVFELYSSYLDCNGHYYVSEGSVPDFEFPNLEFERRHRELLTAAVRRRDESLGRTTTTLTHVMTWEDSPRSELTPSIPPPTDESDIHSEFDELSLDGQSISSSELSDVQILAQTLEHKAGIRPPANSHRAEPRSVGLMDQPIRSRKELACLTAIHKINGQLAYVLYDSGSTTNSITPEFANATRAPRITLTEQVTLQLGCVGSRSKINYGTRVPVEIGGIKGHVYFDQVHIDRYDGIIGTPLLNRHNIILDFQRRVIRFPNGQEVQALTVLEEAALIAERGAEHRPRSYTPPTAAPTSN